MNWTRRLRVGLVLSLCLLALIGALGALSIHVASSTRAANAAPAPSAIPFPSARRVETVAFIGDSYSAGTGSSGYNSQFTTLVAAYEGWQPRNFAYGGTGYHQSVTKNAAVGCGSSFCPAYPQVIPKLKTFDPTVIMVSGGRNDVRVDAKVEEDAIRSFYAALRHAYPTAQIYATSPLWDSTSPPAQLTVIGTEVKAAVQSVKGEYLDIGQPLEGERDLVASDGIHPNDLGHAAIAQAIEVALNKAK